MKILITGAKGFVGKNLSAELRNRNYSNIFEYDTDSGEKSFQKFTQECEFVFHLAGTNRPKDENEFMKNNFGFTQELLSSLKKYNNKSPILMTSSIQAELDNPYGKSKKEAEEILFSYSKETGTKVFIYRLPNIFGKWCKPNYNSVVATFSYNIANCLKIKVNKPNSKINLVYIDDVLDEFINALAGKTNSDGKFYKVSSVFQTTVGMIADLIISFRDSRENFSIPDMSDEFVKKLYSTYLSFLPENKFNYDLRMNLDDRGSFTEFIKTKDRGQISINIIKPGITKGNHWHHTKSEKFFVVSGNGVIRFRKVGSGKVIKYYISEGNKQVLDIPPGYTHNLENLGDRDMVTIMWANECYDPKKPDTYNLKV